MGRVSGKGGGGRGIKREKSGKISLLFKRSRKLCLVL